ncbi:MAG TPA: hypothetical protein VGD45_20385 [Steroidobacter sp.]|uniref:hypothetical protein n=1 Tax=Steroidobacter sp. TaxID=1978227 RepID=UPI002ED8C9DF
MKIFLLVSIVFLLLSVISRAARLRTGNFETSEARAAGRIIAEVALVLWAAALLGSV